MNTNWLTFLISIFFLPIWLVWELIVIKMRGEGADVGTISMVMRARGYQMTALPFFWSAMMAHWWWNWIHTKTWQVPYPAIVFWAMVAGTLALDIYLWHTPFNTLHPWLKFYRAPMIQCIVGFLAAYFFFPQRMLLDHPGWRWW